MGIAILKQIINSATRNPIDTKHSRVIRAGGRLSLRQMIKSAIDHEKSHKSIPTMEIQTTFHVASMTSRSLIHKDEEKAFLRKDYSITKNLDEKMDQLLQAQQEGFQIAADNFKQRGRTPENFNKFKLHSRSASASSQRSNGGALSDGDGKMQTDDSPARVNKKPYEQRQKPRFQMSTKKFEIQALYPVKKPWQSSSMAETPQIDLDSSQMELQST